MFWKLTQLKGSKVKDDEDPVKLEDAFLCLGLDALFIMQGFGLSKTQILA